MKTLVDAQPVLSVLSICVRTMEKIGAASEACLKIPAGR